MSLYVERKYKKNISADIIPFCIEREVLEEDYPIHSHDFAQLFVVSKGKATHIINGREYPIEAGFVYVVTDSIPHGFVDVQELELYNILYDSPKLMERAGKLKQYPGFQALFYLQPFYQLAYNYENRLILDFEGITYVVKILDILLDEVEARWMGYETIIQSYFMILITYLSRKYREEDRKGLTGLLYIAHSVAFLEKHFFENISISDLAYTANLSERQYDRVFKAAYGTTPKQYLIRLRVEHACRLLKIKKGSITEIAYDSGFSDGNYFSRIFKRFMGISPSEYRELSTGY